MFNIQKLKPEDPQWLCAVQADPAATVFDHPAWMGLLSACYGYRPFIFALQNASGELSAGIPFAEVNDHLTPRRWVALPFSDYCTPLYRTEESLCHLSDSLVEQFQQKQCPRLEIRTALPLNPQIQMCDSFVLHTVMLEADSAKVAKRAHRQQMQNVRTAEKNGIRVERGTGIEEVRAFYRLHCQVRRRHGVPVQPWRFFQLIHRFLLEPGLGFVMLAYKDSQCVSAGLFLHWQKTLTYKYSATDEASLDLRPNHLVTWKAMEWGCEQGYTAFDFGRADLEDEGLRSYKRRWGAAETPLTYAYLPTIPEEKGTGKLGELMKKVLQRSPVWVSQAAGEILYRFVG